MFRKTESGQTLIMALALLAVGSLLVLPVLTSTFTNLNYNQTIECRTLNDYSADAGLQYVTCQIYNDPGTYTTSPISENLTINDRTVYVNSSYIGGGLFSVNSTAYGGGCGKTTITSVVNLSVGSFAYAVAAQSLISISSTTIDSFPESGSGHIYSNGDIEITGASSWVEGDASCVGSITKGINQISGDKNQGAPPLQFPSVYAELYKAMAQEGETYYDNLVISVPRDLGPAYITGDLEVMPNTTVTLTGPVYVEGEITTQPEGKFEGREHLLAAGDIRLTGGGYGSEDIPVLISLEGNITLVGAIVDAVVYAPLGRVDVTNVGLLFGAVGGEVCDIGNTDILYSESLHGRTDLPGSELYPLTYTYD